MKFSMRGQYKCDRLIQMTA